MASPENGSFTEKAADVAEKTGIVTGVVGVLLLNAPVVALGMLAFIGGDYVEGKFKK